MTAQSTTSRSPALHRPALPTMWVGLALTVAATVFALLDNMTSRLLATHIQASYPAYSTSEVDVAVNLYVVILCVVGALAALSWLAGVWAARSRKSWTVWAGAFVVVVAATIVVSGLTVTDTSGDVGLAPAMGWLQVLPLAVGVIAVVQLWRQRR